ncbi:hypothetical protein [Gloeobacter kilaueensis]|nr:hypothetical protein [Gloeobacter kilaueensis]
MADLLELPPPEERTPEHRALLARRICEDPHIARVRLHWERLYRERTGCDWPGTHQQETAT